MASESADSGLTVSLRLLAVKPLSVRLLGENRPFSAEKTYEVSCEVVGARPVPHITWWKGKTQLRNDKLVVSLATELVTSLLNQVWR